MAGAGDLKGRTPMYRKAQKLKYLLPPGDEEDGRRDDGSRAMKRLSSEEFI
jgi:hypothetical protein